MRCALCDNNLFLPKPVRHLPRFVRCPNCTGYVTAEKETANYPAEYFSDAPEKPKQSIFSPVLDFFLWLRMRKIRGVLNKKNVQNPPPPQTAAPPLEKEESGREGTCHILDYGCGNGKLVAYLRGKGFDVNGYDPEPSAVALAQRQGLPVFGEMPDKKYDLVMFWHCLEHSNTPLRDILAINYHVEPNGRLLIAVPNGDSLEARITGESFFCYDWPFHRVHFTPHALTALLEKAGFRVLSADHFNPEYTISSLVQTILNLFLPKNALYSFVSARRQTVRKGKLLLLGLASLFALAIFSPVLVLFFISALLLKKTAAFIMVAEEK